jgi:ribosome-associated translation inhibitor RaiA
MHFQVRTDNHIPNSEALIESVRAEVEAAIHPRFTHWVRRIEVYLQDTNAPKGGIDTRCSIEASLSGHQPIAVAEMAENVDDAVSGAIDKLVRVLDKTMGRLDDKGGRTSMSGEPT